MLPKRKSHRLNNYDYGSYGYYYVTICTYNKEKLLSSIVGSDALVAPKHCENRQLFVKPTALGEKINECWQNIEKLNDNVFIDKYVLMPNHIHGIIIIQNTNESAIQNQKYGFEIAERRGRRSLQGLIKDFKSVTTRYYKNNYGKNHSLWQASFFDEVIKSEKHYLSILNYIEINPLKWALDKYYI